MFLLITYLNLDLLASSGQDPSIAEQQWVSEFCQAAKIAHNYKAVFEYKTQKSQSLVPHSPRRASLVRSFRLTTLRRPGWRLAC